MVNADCSSLQCRRTHNASLLARSEGRRSPNAESAESAFNGEARGFGVGLNEVRFGKGSLPRWRGVWDGLCPSPECKKTFWIKMVHFGAFCALFYRAKPMQLIDSVSAVPLVPSIIQSLDCH